MRKKTSANYINEKKLKDECAMIYTLGLISGRWKPILFWKLMENNMRFSEFKKEIPAISERMLASQLKEMEADKLIKKTIYKEMPPKVEYELTALGISLSPALLMLSVWGTKNYKKISDS
jgi:DNA-binding HxlR family transcriptional regulator